MSEELKIGDKVALCSTSRSGRVIKKCREEDVYVRTAYYSVRFCKIYKIISINRDRENLIVSKDIINDTEYSFYYSDLTHFKLDSSQDDCEDQIISTVRASEASVKKISKNDSELILAAKNFVNNNSSTLMLSILTTKRKFKINNLCEFIYRVNNNSNYSQLVGTDIFDLRLSKKRTTNNVFLKFGINGPEIDINKIDNIGTLLANDFEVTNLESYLK